MLSSFGCKSQASMDSSVFCVYWGHVVGIVTVDVDVLLRQFSNGDVVVLEGI